jgi:phage-related protein
VTGPLGEANVEVRFDLSKAEQELESRLILAVDKAGRKIDRSFQILERKVANTAEGMAGDLEDAFSDAERSAESSAREMSRTVDRALGKISRSAKKTERDLDGVGKALRGIALAGLLTVGAGVAAGAAAGLVSNLFAIVGAAAAASGALLVIPAVGAAAAAALGVVKLGAIGLEDAFSALASGDAAELQESLEKLSPSAAAFVKELSGVKPVFDSIRRDIQGRLFAGLADQIQPLADRLLPLLRTGGIGVADALNRAVVPLGAFLRESQTARDIGGVFDSVRASVDLLAPAFVPAARAIRDLVAVGAGEVPAIADSIAGAIQRISDRIAQARADGSLGEFMRNGLEAAKQLGQVLGNVAGIIGDVVAAASQAGGGGALAGLVQITQTIQDFTGSAAGQAALLSFFESLRAIGAAVSPVIVAVANAIGVGLAPILATLATAVSPGVVAFIDALAIGLKALAPAAGPVGQALSAVLTALAPLLPVIGALAGALLTQFANSLTVLSSVLGPVLSSLSGPLTQAFLALQPALVAIGAALGPVADQLGAALGEAVLKVVSILPQLVTILVDTLLPRLPELLDAFLQLVPVIGQVADVLAGGLADALIAIAPDLPAIVDGMLDLAIAVTGLVVAVSPITIALFKFLALLISLAPAPGVLVAALGVLTGVFDTVAGAVTGVQDAFSAVSDFITDTVPAAFTAVGDAVSGFFTDTLPGLLDQGVEKFLGLVTGIGSALAALPGVVKDAFVAVLDAVLFDIGVRIGLILAAFLILPGKIGEFISQAVAFIAALPGRAATALSNLASSVGAKVEEMKTGAQAKIQAFLTGAQQFISTLPSRASSALSGLRAAVVNAVTGAFSAAQSTVSGFINRIQNVIASLPGKVAALAGRFAAAGRGIIDALGRGIASAGGFASDLGSRIAGALRSAVNAVISRINAGIASIDAKLPGGLPRLPQLAHGAVVRTPLVAQLAEAGPEVVIPLTRPGRASQLAQESGLVDILRAEGALGGNVFNISPVLPTGDPMAAAMAVANRIAASV